MDGENKNMGVLSGRDAPSDEHSTEPALLPCPFCGGAASAFSNFTIKDAFVVECDECKADTGYCKTEAKAIAAWNCRTTISDEAARDLLIALKALIASSLRVKGARLTGKYMDAINAAEAAIGRAECILTPITRG